VGHSSVHDKLIDLPSSFIYPSLGRDAAEESSSFIQWADPVHSPLAASFFKLASMNGSGSPGAAGFPSPSAPLPAPPSAPPSY